MIFAFYRGTSTVSKLIRFFTRGIYSHVAVQVEDGRIFEAWHSPAKVRVIHDFGEGHERGTRVDLFELALPFPEKALAHLERSVGRRYDFKGVLGFLTKRTSDDRRACFCSELATEVSIIGGRPALDRVKPFKVSPTMLSMSPLLEYRGSLTTKKYDQKKKES